MVKRGPEPKKSKELKQEIMGLLYNNSPGLGFNDLYRSLSHFPNDKKLGSYSTLSTCLKELVKEGSVIKEPKTGKYRDSGYLSYELRRVETSQMLDNANIIGGDSFHARSSLFEYASADIERLTKSNQWDKINTLWRETQIKELLTSNWLEAYTLGIYMSVDFEKLGIKTSKLYASTGLHEEETNRVLNKIISDVTFKESKTGTTVPNSFQIVSKMLDISFFYSFLQEVLSYSLKEKLIVNINEITSESLQETWNKIFNGTNKILITHMINPKELLMWLNTEQGKIHLKNVLDTFKK